MPSDQEKHLHHDLVMWMSHRPIPKTLDQAEDYTRAAEKKIEDLIFVLKSSQSLKKANASLNSATERRAARQRAYQFNSESIESTIQTRDGALANTLQASLHAVADIDTQVTVRTPQEVQTQLLDELLRQARTLSSQVNHFCSTSEKMIAELRQMISLKEAEYFQRNQKPTF
jgi:hypothetical protein